ncbi:MAG: hypothetical protein C0179_04920 [Fervidicoccus sp.]|nr:MAG: hypothetical protein C0179_04920 [Fervidicoccus sp.]
MQRRGEELRLLVITGYGKRLSVEGKVFKVEDRNKSSSKVNPADIESIVIESSGVSITSAAIELASMAGIPIFIIRGRGSPTVISPIYSVKRSPLRPEGNSTLLQRENPAAPSPRASSDLRYRTRLSA